MVVKHITVLTDDIDHSEGAESISFTFDGVSYDIDLNEHHAGEFRSEMHRWIQHARKSSVTRAPSTRVVRQVTRRSREELNSIRLWARNNNHKVSDRGRIPAKIIAEYDAAH